MKIKLSLTFSWIFLSLTSNLTRTYAATLPVVDGGQFYRISHPTNRVILLTQLEAQTLPNKINSSHLDNKRVIFVTPKNPRQENPQRRTGKPRRGDGDEENNQCKTVDKLELTVISPESVRGLTIKEKPTLYIYIPYASNSKLSAELSLTQAQKTLPTRKPIQLTGIPGIISIPINSLELEQDYSWNFTIICNPQDRNQDDYVEGWIRRTTLNSVLMKQIEIAHPEQRAIIYAQQGIWYDTIETLFDEQFRRNNSKKAASLFNSLLQVNLNNITEKQLVPCCKQEK